MFGQLCFFFLPQLHHLSMKSISFFFVKHLDYLKKFLLQIEVYGYGFGKWRCNV